MMSPCLPQEWQRLWRDLGVFELRVGFLVCPRLFRGLPVCLVSSKCVTHCLFLGLLCRLIIIVSLQTPGPGHGQVTGDGAPQHLVCMKLASKNERKKNRKQSASVVSIKLTHNSSVSTYLEMSL